MDIKICHTSELDKCYWPMFSKAKNTVKCDCPQPCSMKEYNIHSSSAAFPTKPLTEFLVDEKLIKSAKYARSNLILVSISFERMIVQHVEHIPEMSWGDIFGKLGGQMGFFLGASLLTLSELAETVIMTMWIVGSRVCTFSKSQVKPFDMKPANLS
ncbi:acid-sensing ion channel 3-like [Gigantopelta aegis]|uniref:acid-sensing ion channel 3-like n=1 Tax=Gigantopelta aegis TaxID=1735272 RepID=UPI001B88D396|nr:acid-sensing ion channel 3-like [Gigantopelta aegis]